VSPPSESARPSILDTRRLVTEGKALARASAFAVGLVGTIALVRACSAGSPKPKTLDGLVEGLSSAAHVVVRPDEFVWEGSDGVLLDFSRGRHILFLGAEKPGAPRDLYRARVHLSPEGTPLDITDVVNLTKSPDGDEQGLVRDATAERAAFATFGLGHLQGITALDLRSKARASQAKTALERGMLWVTNLQEDGDGDGIARVQVMLEREATAAILAFDGPTLVMQLAQAQGGVRVARVDVDQATVVGNADGLNVSLEQQVPKQFTHWCVDTVRYVVGPEPIAWLEAKVWELKDRWLRFRHKALDGRTAAQDEVKTEKEQLDIIAKALDPSAAGEDGGFWPPQPVPTLYKTPEPGEGQWVAFERPWMHSIPGAPSPFYQTFIRPDPERPYSKIILVAMDTRQLDFDMEAGTEDPKSTVGAFHGTGRLPRDAKVAVRAVAAFNGGFKSEHGHYGMMLRKHVLLPPVPNAASAVVMDDGRFGMGAWGPTKDIGVDLLAYRQNLDPLIDGGLINPRNRGSWGAVLPGQPKLTGQQTERSGLCLTRAKHLLYVWGDDVGADALGKGMQLAGCDFGMHLDMNPHHTGFVFMSFDDAVYKNGKSEVLTGLMAVSNRRYIDYAPKDFFYALMRDPMPDFGGGALHLDPGLQPQPTWLPAIFTGDARPDGVIVTTFEPGRLRFRLRAGADEKATTDVAREITGDDAKRVIAAIGLGLGDSKKGAGLVVDRKVSAPSQTGFATLWIDGEGALSIAAPGEATPADAVDLVQGPALVIDGKVVDDTPRNATFVHVAIGITKTGRVVVARGTLSSDEPLAKALVGMGCVRAVAARGDVDGFLARAGTATAPMTSYPQTTLYAIAQPMGPRAFRFDQDPKGKPLWPAVTTPVP
jgi:hypothetical protein